MHAVSVLEKGTAHTRFSGNFLLLVCVSRKRALSFIEMIAKYSSIFITNFM